MGSRRHDIRRGRRRPLGLRGAAPPSAPASHLGSASPWPRARILHWNRTSGATLGCDACDGQVRTPEGFESPGILRLSADPTATAKCELWVRRQVRTRRSRKPRDSAAFGRSGAHLSATGATGRFAPRRTQNLGNLRLSGRQVRRVGAKCEPGITPCRWRCIGRGPPVSVFAKEGPRCAFQTSLQYPVTSSACYYHVQNVFLAQQGTYLQQSTRRLGIEQPA
jgi:hypothetical protein